MRTTSGSRVQPVTYDKLRNVLLKLAGTDAHGVVTDPNDPDFSFGYRYMRGATAAPAKPEFAPFIINATSGYAFQEYEKNMPIAAYNVETTPPTRLMMGFLENNAAGGLVNGQYYPGLTRSSDGQHRRCGSAGVAASFLMYRTAKRS